MPGVRYGPDIADDAAYILDTVTELQRRLARGATLGKRDRGRYDNLKELANSLYGVRARDFDKGKFGDLAELAKYGDSRSRSRMAKGRDGRPMRKSVEQEFAERGSGVRKPGTSTKPVDGTYYVGRTKSKRFTQLEQAAMRRASRNKIKYGKASVDRAAVKRGGFQAQIDKLNLAKARTSSSSVLNRPRGSGQNPRKPGLPIRPPLAKSQQKNQQRAKKADSGGRTGGKARR